METLRSKNSKFRFFAISIGLPRRSNPKINAIICFSCIKVSISIFTVKLFRIGKSKVVFVNRNCVCSKHHKCLKWRINCGWILLFRKNCCLERGHGILRQHAYSSGELFVCKNLSFAIFVGVKAAGCKNFFCLLSWLTSIFKFMYLHNYRPNFSNKVLKSGFCAVRFLISKWTVSILELKSWFSKKTKSSKNDESSPLRNSNKILTFGCTPSIIF